jgi:hypothetical protein
MIRFLKLLFNIDLGAGVPEWPNGLGLGPSGLVPTQVRTLSPAFI